MLSGNLMVALLLVVQRCYLIYLAKDTSQTNKQAMRYAVAVDWVHVLMQADKPG